MFRLLKFALPFAIWIFLVRDFLSGAIPLNMDTNTIYAVTKYYFNNLLNGVVPLWEPFIGLGRPFYAISICNLFNPATQLVVILKLLGVDYNIAFTVYIAVYFWVGCIGFYFLAKRILNDRNMAYLAYLSFMFSSLGIAAFTQLTFLEIVVPTIWFFYFLLSFAAKQNKGHFLGLSLSIMIVLSAYLPFYFLTVAGVFVLLAAALYPRDVLTFMKASARFKLAHWRLGLFAGVGILMAAGPLLAYKVLDASGDTVSPGRHCQYASAQECYDRTMNHKGGMLYEEIARSGSLGERLDLDYLFTHLDKITYGSDSLLFIPVWIFVLLALSIFLRADRLNVLLAAMIVFIGLVALGDSTPVHRFLYEHVFFFAYFRNLFFLGAFLVPLIILLGIKQLQALLALKPEHFSGKKFMIVAVLGIHGLFAAYLHRYTDIMPVAYATVGLSAVLFAVYYAGVVRLDVKAWTAIFAFVLIGQPMAVMAAYSANATEFKCALPSAHVRPSFSWVRPDKPATSNCRIYQFVPYEDFWYAMSMTDAPPKVGYPQAAARWTFELSQTQGDAALSGYAKYKVYLYESLNTVGTPVTSASAMLDVAYFDVNRVVFKTHFDRRQFFVYNDSFTHSWKARIDGKSEELHRANGAFKGVWVPAGAHTLEFFYQPPGGQWVYILATAALFVFLILTIIMLS